MLRARFLVFWLETRSSSGRPLDGLVALVTFGLVFGTGSLLLHLVGVDGDRPQTACAVVAAVLSPGVLLLRGSRLGDALAARARSAVVHQGGDVTRH